MKIYHWWPGRKWAGPCPIPRYIIEKSERMGTRYMTVARQEVDGLMYEGIARCCPRDVPDKQLGRKIAIGRLAWTVKKWTGKELEA